MSKPRNAAADASSGGLLSHWLTACFPAAVVLVSLPVEMYIENQKYLNYNVLSLSPFLIGAALWAIGSAGLLALLPPRLRRSVALGSLFFGLFLLGSDVVAPVQLEELEASVDFIPEPAGLITAEVLVAVALGALWYFVPGHTLRQIGVALTVLFALTAPLRLMSQASDKTNFDDPDGAARVWPEPHPMADLPNIYHVVWDAYSSYALEPSVEVNELRDRLDGFVWFRENRTNYLNTRLSRPSFLSGTHFDPEHLERWMHSSRTGGVVTALSEAGYSASFYVRNRGWLHERASHVVTNVGLTNRRNGSILTLQLIDLWLVRIVPTALQNEVYWDGKGIASRYLRAQDAVAGEDERVYSSMELARQVIEDEKNRPARGQYIHAHVYIPHGPYVLRRDCSYAAAATSYEEQSACSTLIMAELADELRRLGRFEDSLIIFQADHGSWETGLQELPGEIALPDVAAAMAGNVRQLSAPYVENQTRALLLVKPPGISSQPLEVSDWRTQLLDVAATLLDMIDESAPESGQSHSLLKSPFPEDRVINVYMGYKQRSADGKRNIYFGNDFEEGWFNHYSIDPEGRWTAHPNIRTHW